MASTGAPEGGSCAPGPHCGRTWADQRCGRALPPQVAYLGFSLLGSWLILRWALKQMDPNKSSKSLVGGFTGGGGSRPAGPAEG